jgi:hypothetical protein
MLRSQLESERKETIPEYPKSIEPAETASKIKIKVRFDYRGLPRPARFFFGGKGSREVAEELRQQQAAMWRNVPLQGVSVEEVEFMDLYTVYDEAEEELITYAPMELKVLIDSLEDCLRFVTKDEFRRVEILDPPQLTLRGRDLERILYRFGESLQRKLKEARA